MINYMPKWKQFLNEGALTTYRTEREGMKLQANQLCGSFDEFVVRLIKERIPFEFDCQYKNFTRIGYLMHKSINGKSFDGYILDNNIEPDKLADEFKNKIVKDIIVEKPGRINIGLTDFSNASPANDIETIEVVVKAIRGYYKDKGLSEREITGNKRIAKVKIEFLCDKTRINDLIDFVF